MLIDFKWNQVTDQALDKATFERMLQARLPPFLSRLVELPERLLVEIREVGATIDAHAYPPNGELLLSATAPSSAPGKIHIWFRGDAPAHKMISTWENEWEESQS